MKHSEKQKMILGNFDWSKKDGLFFHWKYGYKTLNEAFLMVTCKHLRSERIYIGEGRLKCKICGTTFKE